MKDNNYKKECDINSCSLLLTNDLNNTDVKKASINNSNSEEHIIFENKCLLTSIFELLIFSSIQYYNFCIFSLGYAFNFYFLSIKYPSGNLNAKIVAAIGMCNLFFNAIVVAILRGLTSGYDILASARIGSKDYIGFWKLTINCTITIFTISLIIAIITHLFGIYLITFLFNTDSKLEGLIDDYLYFLVFVIPIMSFSYMITKVVSITKKNKGYSAILTITLCLEILSSYLYICIFDLNIKGASLALLTSRLILVILGFIYFLKINTFKINFLLRILNIKKNNELTKALINKNNNNCSKFNTKLNYFQEAISYLKFTMPNTFSICIGSWQLEIAALIAYSINSKSYISFVIFNTLSMFYSNLTSSIGSGMVAFCGNNIGRNNMVEFKKNLLISYILLWVVCGIFSVIIMLFNFRIYSLLITDYQIIYTMQNTTLLFLLWQLLNCTFSICCYYYRIINKQFFFMNISIFNYYVLQTVLAIISTYVLRLDINGLYISLSMGHIICILVIYFNDRLDKHLNKSNYKNSFLITLKNTHNNV